MFEGHLLASVPWRTMIENRATPGNRVVVVGAGVVGASIAHHLARAGRDVVVLDGGAPAGGVTAASFAWVGLAKSSAEDYGDTMRGRAAFEFDRVKTELSSSIGLRRCGAITWEETDAATRAFVSAHQAAGHRMELIAGHDVSAHEPGLRHVPKIAAHAPDDLGIDPVAYTRSLLQSAQRHGAEVQVHTPVLSLLTDSGRVRGVLTGRGELAAVSVILAAGTGSVQLAGTIGVDIGVKASPCCLIRFSTPRPLVRGILSTPDLEIRQLDDTTLLAAEDVPVDFDGHPVDIAAPVIDVLRTHLKGAENLQLQQAVIADRPIPADGRPLVGPAPGAPGLYLAIAHPAVILSAVIGRQVAADHSSLD